MGKGCGCGASKVARVPSVHPQPIVQEEDDEVYWNLYVSWTGEDEQQRPDRLLLTPQPQYGTTATATGAVRLSFFLDFIARALPLGDPDMPTWSVALNIVQPATLDKGVPYVGLPEMAQHVQPYDSTAPYYFVSHAWTRPLSEAAGLLSHQFRGSDARNVFVWLDVFAVRQQAFTASAGPVPQMKAVDAAILGSSGVLLCVDEAGHSLRRTWCLYEAWRATHVSSGGQNTPLSTASGGAGGDVELGVGPVGLVVLTPRVLLPEERATLFCKIDVRQSRSKYRSDRDTLFATLRAAVGPGGLAAVNWGIRVALCMQSLVPDVGPELYPGRLTQVPDLWDFSRVYDWLDLTDKDVNYSALTLYGPPTSGKSTTAAALASSLRSRRVPVAAAFCSASDVRSLDPLCVVVSLALQLARLPRLGPRLARMYGNLPPGVLTDLMSYNSSTAGLEAAVEALLVRPLQALLQPQTDNIPEEEDGDASLTGTGELSQEGGQEGGQEGEEVMGEEEGSGAGGAGVGGRSMRAVSTHFVPPKAVVLIIDGLDQADGLVTGGAAPFDNQVLQLIEEHLLKLPSFVRLVLTSRPLPYIVPRLSDRLSPRELAPEMLRPLSPFMRNLRLSVAAMDRSLNHRQRSAIAANVVTKSRGSLLYIKMAIACLEQEFRQREREAPAPAGGGQGGDVPRGAASAAFYGDHSGSMGDTGTMGGTGSRLPSSSSRRQLGGPELPSSLGELFDRYLATRLRHLPSPDLRLIASAVLAVLVAAREPLALPQLATAVRGVMGGDLASGLLVDDTVEGVGYDGGGEGGDGTAAGPGGGGGGDAAAVVEVVLQGLGLLVRRRGRRAAGGGWRGGEVQLAHPAVMEWLQQYLPPALLAGSLPTDNLPTAGHLALAATATADILNCLDRGKLLPYDYHVRHLFLHVGLAALATAVAEEETKATGAGGFSGIGGATGIIAAAAALRRRSRRRYTIGADAAATAAAESLETAADSATASDWPTVLELLLQRLDVWTSIYAAGAGGWSRSSVLGLSCLPPLTPPAADPASATDSPLVVVLGEVRRWLLLFHGQMVWYPMSVVAAAATLPEDAVLRGRALEFAAGPDPYERLASEPPTTTSASGRPPASPAKQLQGATDSAPIKDGAGGGVDGRGAPQEQQQQQQQGPRESQHLLLLSTGDVWGACVASLRTAAGAAAGPMAAVAAAALAPNGRLLATVHSGEQWRGALLWDVWGGRMLHLFAYSHLVGPDPTAAFFTLDGRKLVCAAHAGIFIWEVTTGRLLFGPVGPTTGRGDQQHPGDTDPEGPITALAMSPNGDRLAAGHVRGTVRLWEVASGRLLYTLTVPHGRPVTALAFRLPKGATLVVAHGEGGEVAPRAQAPVGMEELGDVPTAFIMADDLTLHVWRVVGTQPRELEVLKGHTARVNALTFSTVDGNMVTGSADETIRTWWNDPKTPQSDYRQLFILGGAGHGPVHALQYSPAPPSCMTPAHAAATAAAAAPPTPLVAALSRRLVSSISVKPNGSGGITASGSTAADDGAGDLVASAAAVSVTSLIAATFHANAVLLDVTDSDVSGSGSGSSARSSARNSGTGYRPGGGGGAGGGGASAAVAGSKSPLPLMAYSPGTGIIRLWSQSQQRQVGLLRGLEGKVGSLQWSGDGRLLVSADLSATGDVRVWDVGGASPSNPLDCSPTSGAGGLPLRHPVAVMALSPDGSRLAVVCADLSKENVRVIDVFSGRRLAVMAPAGAGGHEGKINAVSWSWDSSRLATGSDDQSVRVWYVGPPTAPPGNPLAAAAAIVAAQQQARVAGSTDDTGAGDDVPEVAYVAVSGGLVAAARPGLCQLILSGHHRKVQCVAWAHNGRKLASGGYDQMIRIWDAATGEQLNLIYQISWVSALAFSPDDARLASGGGGKAVFIFNSTTGKNLASNPGQAAEQPAAAAAAPAEEGGATEGGGGTPAPAGGESSSAVRDSWMAALRFNPNGTLLACRDTQYGITLWDVSGLRLRPLRALEGNFREALFCPVTGDLQLYGLTGSGSLLQHVISAALLPLGRPVQSAVALSHPLLSFRGVALDTALGHNAAVLLTGDNRAFFFVSGSHLAAVRQEAVRSTAQQGQSKGRELGWVGGGGRRGGAGEASTAVSRVVSMR